MNYTKEEYKELGFVVNEIIKELIETDLKDCTFKMSDLITMISFSLGFNEQDIKKSLIESKSPYQIKKATYVLDGGKIFSSTKLSTYATNIERKLLAKNKQANNVFQGLYTLEYQREIK